MRGRAEAALAALTRTPPPGSREEAASRQRGMFAEADSVVSFGESMWSPDAAGPVHERVENSLRRGIGSYYELGQLLAMPALLDRPGISAVPVGRPVYTPPDSRPVPLHQRGRLLRPRARRLTIS